MPLRLVNKERTHAIQVCDTTFHVISMSIGDKERLLAKIQGITTSEGSFDELLAILAPAIARIDGFDEEPLAILKQIEEVDDLREIIRAIVWHCDLAPSEIKNSRSSSAQPTPESAGNAVKPVGPDDEPASTTPTQMAS